MIQVESLAGVAVDESHSQSPFPSSILFQTLDSGSRELPVLLEVQTRAVRCQPVSRRLASLPRGISARVVCELESSRSGLLNNGVVFGPLQAGKVQCNWDAVQP